VSTVSQTLPEGGEISHRDTEGTEIGSTEKTVLYYSPALSEHVTKIFDIDEQDGQDRTSPDEQSAILCFGLILSILLSMLGTS
jgi:hypothetical protein